MEGPRSRGGERASAGSAKDNFQSTDGAASPSDLQAWAEYEQKTSPRPIQPTNGVPVGLFGLLDEGSRSKLSQEPIATRPSVSREEQPVAPALSSRKRYQAVQVADVAAWNVTGNPASLPMGLVGVLPDEHLEKVFDAQAEDLEALRRRNVELASLLHEQHVELEAEFHEKKVAEHLAREEEHYKRLERTNSLLLNQKIAIACRQYAAESEEKLHASQEQVRQLQVELRRAADAAKGHAVQLEEAHKQIDALKSAQCPACRGDKVPSLSADALTYL